MVKLLYLVRIYIAGSKNLLMCSQNILFLYFLPFLINKLGIFRVFPATHLWGVLQQKS